MNIYLLIEDGESFCVKAETMNKAIKVCEKGYLDDREKEDPRFNKYTEKTYYHEQILKSCFLVGELRN